MDIIVAKHLLVSPETNDAFKNNINYHMPKIRAYFEERQWTLKDYNNKDWTYNGNTDYLGEQKNLYGECTNCNGVSINRWAEF